MRLNGKMFAGALLLVTSAACKIDMRQRGTADYTGTEDVTGTYFAADSGHNLGKNWCYSGALVLDSTKHFGSVITMCDDKGGGRSTEHLKGTYKLRTSTIKSSDGSTVTKLDVILNQEPRGKTHTLRYADGTLRFDEPWWLGAGLRALEIPDPVLKKVSAAQMGDSIPISAASSTPAVRKSSATAPRAKKP